VKNNLWTYKKKNYTETEWINLLTGPMFKRLTQLLEDSRQISKEKVVEVTLNSETEEVKYTWKSSAYLK